MAGENRQERKRIGTTYALALYDLASQNGALDAVRDQLNVWSQVFSQDPALLHFFDSVVVSPDDRRRFLDEVQKDFSPLLVNFLGVMNRRNRLGVLPEVIAAFRDEDDRRCNRVRVKLTTAAPIDAHLTEEIRQLLQRYLRQEPVIEHRIRPEIIGGFLAHAGDLLIDGSVKTRIAMLEKNLLRRGEDEIQSRRDFISYQT